MIKGFARGFFAILLVSALLALIYWMKMLARPEYDPILNVAFVGTQDDADCIVLWQKDFAMLIDTGEEQDAPSILKFLEEQGIRELDYLILTHPDKDHIGSAAEIIRSLKVSTAITPYYQKVNDNMSTLNSRLSHGGVRTIIPSRVLRYSFHDVDILVYPPQEKHYNDDNNYSLGVLVSHGEVNLFFPGDAEDKRLDEMMKLDLPEVKLLKMPHHGRYHAATVEMLRLLSPEYAVVTAREASSRLNTVCEELGAELFFTVAGKTAWFTSDGSALNYIAS